MSTRAEAIVEFSVAYSNLLKAAEKLRDVLAAEAGVRREQPCQAIINLVGRYYGFTAEEIVSKRRTRDLAMARQAAMWLCRALTPLVLQVIGEVFHRDHGTVMWAIESVNNRLSTEPRFASELLELRRRCEEAIK